MCISNVAWLGLDSYPTCDFLLIFSFALQEHRVYLDLAALAMCAAMLSIVAHT